MQLTHVNQMKQIGTLISSAPKIYSDLGYEKKPEIAKPWFDEIYAKFINNWRLVVTSGAVAMTRAEWLKRFPGLTKFVADRAADICMNELDKVPNIKQFGEMVSRAKKELGLILKEPEPAADQNSEMRRLVNEGSEIVKLIKKLKYHDTKWSMTLSQQIAADLNKFKKEIQMQKPNASDLDVLLEVKDDLEYALLKRKQA